MDDGGHDDGGGHGDAGGHGDDCGHGDAGEHGDDCGHGGTAESADDTDVKTFELVIVAVAVAFTVALFSFAAWHALAGATDARPTATVTGVAAATGNATYYDVSIRNPGDAGVASATVAVECPDPARTVTFENVPANVYRNATVRCPPGGGASADATATVVSWIPG